MSAFSDYYIGFLRKLLVKIKNSSIQEITAYFISFLSTAKLLDRGPWEFKVQDKFYTQKLEIIA